MIVKLKEHISTAGLPAISSVDESIFTTSYFAKCMSCSFCRDWCCSFGVDVDLENIKAIEMHVERILGPGTADLFEKEHTPDEESPGGAFRRTIIKDGACLFLSREERGCLIHKYCLENNIDYHALKPVTCSLYPAEISGGMLYPSKRVVSRALICLGEGPTIYRGIRHELLYYYGEEFIKEMDAAERMAISNAPASDKMHGKNPGLSQV